MKYAPPASAAPDAPYVDGNLSSGTLGSIPPARAIEAPQREIHHIIDFAGLTPSDADTEQLRKAVAAMIAAATGEGDTENFLLMAQARARLPIFPEILTADGKMNVSSPGSGTILVPAAVNIMHRGIFQLSTSDYDEEEDRTFETMANKTYHVRWSPVDGFVLKDVADGAYNPSAYAETHADFDSRYDDMLISRVVTNGGNIATVTNLVNRNRHAVMVGRDATQLIGSPGSAITDEYTLNFARTPIVSLMRVSENTTGNKNDGGESAVYVYAPTRYKVSVQNYAIGITSDQAWAMIYQLNAVMY